MGRGIIESGLFRTERVELEQRTSDPSDPDPEEAWLRVDQKPTYEDANGTTRTGVAEYRIANADGSVDIAPVAQLGHPVGSRVIDKVRPYVDAGGSPTGTGFVPLATSGATYGNRRLDHPNDGRVALHDALTADAVPDSAVADYDAQALSASNNDSIQTWPDELGSRDLTGGDPVYETDGINGNPALHFDGTDDRLDVAFAAETQPNTVFIVLDGDGQIGDGNAYRVFDSEDTTDRQNIYMGGSNEWTIFSGSEIAGSSDTSVQLITAVFDGSNSLLRENGSQTASGDAGSTGLNGISVGASDFGNEWPGYVGEVVPCNERLSSSEIDAEESRLADKWGITL